MPPLPQLFIPRKSVPRSFGTPTVNPPSGFDPQQAKKTKPFKQQQGVPRDFFAEADNEAEAAVRTNLLAVQNHVNRRPFGGNARRVAPQAIAAGAYVIVDLDNRAFDAGGVVDLVNDRMNIPADGVYVVSVTIDWDITAMTAATAGYCYVRLYVNGANSGVAATSLYVVQAATPEPQVQQNFSHFGYVKTNDKLDIRVKHNLAGAITLSMPVFSTCLLARIPTAVQ